MIDFSTIPLQEPLPEVKTLNFEKNNLLDENKALKRTIRVLVIGLIIYMVYQLYKPKKENRNVDD